MKYISLFVMLFMIASCKYKAPQVCGYYVKDSKQPCHQYKVVSSR